MSGDDLVVRWNRYLNECMAERAVPEDLVYAPGEPGQEPMLAKGLKRKEQTVRQQRRAWYYDTPRKRGTKRQALHVETCFPVLLGWVVSWWQGTPRALAIEATALGARFVVLAVSVV